jgi:hypothetical protein
MKLRRLSENSHTLDTSSGSLLFSYEGLTAVRLHDPGRSSAVFRSPGAILSVATRAHLQRFAPGRIPPVLTGRQFADLCRRVLCEID